MTRKPRTFECPRCGERRTERLASAVGHPCPKANKNVIDFKEVKTDE